MIMAQDKEGLKEMFFLGTVITFSLTLYLLSRNTLKQLFIKLSG